MKITSFFSFRNYFFHLFWAVIRYYLLRLSHSLLEPTRWVEFTSMIEYIIMSNVLSVKMNFLIMEKWDRPPTGFSNFLQPIQLFSPEGFCSGAFLKVDSHTFVGPDYTSRHVRVVSSGGAWVSKIALVLGKNKIIPNT